MVETSIKISVPNIWIDIQIFTTEYDFCEAITMLFFQSEVSKKLNVVQCRKCLEHL